LLPSNIRLPRGRDPVKNPNLFKKLVGDDFNRIVLVTIIRNCVGEEVGVLHENELKTDFWKIMNDRRSSV